MAILYISCILNSTLHVRAHKRGPIHKHNDISVPYVSLILQATQQRPNRKCAMINNPPNDTAIQIDS